MSILSVDTIQPIGSGSTVTLNAAKTAVGTGITFESNGQAIYAGIITATSFSGSGANLTSLPAANLTGTLPAISGANLTSLPAQATIANNADNRVITGGSGVNLNGEANLTFNGSALGLTGDLSVVGGWPKINLQATQASGENYQIAGAIQGVNNAGLCIRNTTDSVNILEIDTDSSRNLKVVSGNVIIGTSGKGIDFSATANSSGSMSNELLDDYEEGSWTPHLVSSAGNMSTTSFSFHQGNYTKIGRLVYLTGVMYGPRSSGGTGNLRISNLPYTVRNGDHYQLLTKDYQLSNYPSNFGHVSGYGMNNGTQIQLFKREGSSQAGLPLSWWSTSANDYMYFNLTYQTDT